MREMNYEFDAQCGWRELPIILNLGCGDNLVQGAINVDCFKGEGIDEEVDLTQMPWHWKEESISTIYLTHVLEHFQDQKAVIQECHRILKKGGQLIITVPHSSSCMSVGCMGHYRTYSYDTLRDYLSRPFYMFKETKFKTVYQKLSWWYQRPVKNVPFWMMLFIKPMDKIINFLIWLSPQVFENLWCYWVGGAKEVLWIGEKV